MGKEERQLSRKNTQDPEAYDCYLRGLYHLARYNVFANSAEDHTSDAAAKFWFDWDFKGVEVAGRCAISLNENYALAYLHLAHVLSNTGGTIRL